MLITVTGNINNASSHQSTTLIFGSNGYHRHFARFGRFVSSFANKIYAKLIKLPSQIPGYLNNGAFHEQRLTKTSFEFRNLKVWSLEWKVCLLAPAMYLI